MNKFTEPFFKQGDLVKSAKSIFRITQKLYLFIYQMNLVLFSLCIVLFFYIYLLKNGWGGGSRLYIELQLALIIETRGLSLVSMFIDLLVQIFNIHTVHWGHGLFLLPILTSYYLQKSILRLNPYKDIAVGGDIKDTAFGASIKARALDIQKIGGNLFKGTVIVLGKFKGKFLKMNETLSVLAVAPPGTGKTTAIVVPTIFECDEMSMVINDPKPELCFTTSGYRSTIGPVFILNWGSQNDVPNNVYYPSWNPLSPSQIPQNVADRDLYIGTIVKILIPINSGTSDTYWQESGRSALGAFLHFMVSKCERATANDYFYNKLASGVLEEIDILTLKQYYMEMEDINATTAIYILENGDLNKDNYVPIGSWKTIPKDWRGKEASIPMLLDWYSILNMTIHKEIEDKRAMGDTAFYDDLEQMIKAMLQEGREFGYNRRVILDMNRLLTAAGKERASILSVMLNAIEIFSNQAVRNRTSHSDFTMLDLRGMIDPKDGKFKPVTVYLSINQADALALYPISAMFIDIMNKFLLSRLPGAEHNGKKIGPYPIIFVLDEFPQMPALETVIQGPALGRGQKISYLLIAQDLQQIAHKYSENEANTLMSTTACKIILTQNNFQTAQTFSQMMGTFKTKELKDFRKYKIESGDDRSLYSPQDLMELPSGKQVIIYQNAIKRPIEADAPTWFKDKGMIKKSKIPSAPPIPEYLIENHKANMPPPPPKLVVE
ncbi:MAG: type IV secretory system conjugative DNA transfer family protein [Alphaproteobacteria bacterium]|nr:type IV secretory system conjugative DNA transfer family protein [Alphaproteobacteria bacterium]MBL0718027.1 type IV secretory system conjugative DNA transfer family protein [Alphaproteobacteria bacterium]